jgi:hypothetical protein
MGRGSKYEMEADMAGLTSGGVVWCRQQRGPSSGVVAGVLLCGGPRFRPGADLLGVRWRRRSSWRRLAKHGDSLVGGGKGRFDTGLQVDGSDGQGVAARWWG